MKHVALWCWIVVSFAVAGCRVPTPGVGVGSQVVSCTTEAVRTQWPKVVGPVNECLTRPEGSDWRACLNAISVGANVAVDVVLCVVRGQGASFARAADLNPADGRSVRAAERAQEYVGDVRFVE